MDYKTQYITSFTVLNKHTNSSGKVLFGGELLSKMDIIAAKTLHKFLIPYMEDLKNKGMKTYLTRAVNNINIFSPSFLSDIVVLKSYIKKIGRTSFDITINVSKEDSNSGTINVANGTFTLVTVDKDMRPFVHGIRIIEGD